MLFQARLSAAIEILDDVARHHRPAAEALKDWGRTHRFAGSGDRHAIGTLVYDVLRRRASLAAHMGDDASRALVLAAARYVWNVPAQDIIQSALLAHGPGALTQPEENALACNWAD